MDIHNPGAEEQINRFRSRVMEDLADHGGRAGFELGESFKLLTDL
jgi:hypothetical protein